MKKDSKFELELKDALSVIELEERQEMTVANEALCCGDNSGCNQGCTKVAEAPTASAS